jgi:hypothetical protein
MTILIFAEAILNFCTATSSSALQASIVVECFYLFARQPSACAFPMAMQGNDRRQSCLTD